MAFTDLSFWLALVLFILLLQLLPRRHGWTQLALLVFSYLFYASLSWWFILPLIFSTLLDYICGKYAGSANSPRTRKFAVSLSLIGNLGLLAFFKILVLDSSVSRLSTAWGIDRFLFPIGLSFYTFQSMSYTLDIYRDRIQPARSLLDFSLYVSFFPQLIAGPIERAHHLLPQLEKAKRLSLEMFESALGLILFGLFKKVMVSDKLTYLIAPVFSGTVKDGYTFLLTCVLVTFKVYVDFSAYSQIARGIAKLFGINLIVNFRPFYLARNPAEFWSRWHLSLTFWVRDYLFTPLIGKRPSRLRFYFGLLASFTIIGLWHGLNVNWLLFGVFHGLVMILYQLTKRSLRKLKPLFWHYHTMIGIYLVCGLLHEASSFSKARELIGHLDYEMADPLILWVYIKAVGIILGPLFLVEYLFYNKRANAIWRSVPLWLRGLAYGAIIELIALMNVGQELFIYYGF